MFSVVLSVYKKDNVAFFRMAVDSILAQTLMPAEIIIVVDGDVSKELKILLNNLQLEKLIKIFYLDSNQGIGFSRGYGIKISRYPVIAVMDSDDICVVDRFETQFKVLKETDVDLVGGYIEEFSKYPGDRGSVRRVPLDHFNIVLLGRWRSPINHVTIMFKRSAYDRAGGYKNMRTLEDYDLFHRLTITGSRFCNISKILVHVRFGADTVLRRRGWLYYKTIMGVYKSMLDTGYLGFLRFLVLSVIQIVIRLMPSSALMFAYKLARRRF